MYWPTVDSLAAVIKGESEGGLSMYLHIKGFTPTNDMRVFVTLPLTVAANVSRGSDSTLNWRSIRVYSIRMFTISH